MAAWALIFRIPSNYTILLIHTRPWFPGDGRSAEQRPTPRSPCVAVTRSCRVPLLLSLPWCQLPEHQLVSCSFMLGSKSLVNSQLCIFVFKAALNTDECRSSVAEQCSRHRDASKALLVQEIALSCCSPPFPLSHSLSGLACSWANWLAELQAVCGAEESLLGSLALLWRDGTCSSHDPRSHQATCSQHSQAAFNTSSEDISEV